MNDDYQSNEFDDSNNYESNQDGLNASKSKLVDIRIVLTNLNYIEPISKAVSNFDLSNFNVNISSIIPTDDIGVAKNAIAGSDLVLIACPSGLEGKSLFNKFKKALKTDKNFIEYLKLPSLEEFDDYGYDYEEDNVFEDEIANSIIRAGLYSISNLYSINESKRAYSKLKMDFEEKISRFDKASKENDILINESRVLRERNEKLLEEIKILQKELDSIKSDYSDLKSRFESIHSKNSLEVYSLLELWQELFNESLSEEYYKFILVSTDNFRPKNLMVGQGVVCAESKEDALDWLKIIKTAFILNDANQDDLNYNNVHSNFNFDHNGESVDKDFNGGRSNLSVDNDYDGFNLARSDFSIDTLEDSKDLFPEVSFDDVSDDDTSKDFKSYDGKDDFSEINVFNINSLRNLAKDKENTKEYDYENYDDYGDYEEEGDYEGDDEDIEDVSSPFSRLW